MNTRSLKNPVFKILYRGYGIYWHGGNNFGDETNFIAHSVKEVKERVDAKISAELEARPDHLKYWDTLTHEERNKWRKACHTTELSASELAWTNREAN